MRLSKQPGTTRTRRIAANIAKLPELTVARRCVPPLTNSIGRLAGVCFNLS